MQYVLSVCGVFWCKWILVKILALKKYWHRFLVYSLLILSYFSVYLFILFMLLLIFLFTFLFFLCFYFNTVSYIYIYVYIIIIIIVIV